MAFDSGKGGCRECKMPCSCAQIVLLEVVGGLQTRQEYVSVNAASVGNFESTAHVLVYRRHEAAKKHWEHACGW